MSRPPSEISPGKRWLILAPAMCLPLFASIFYFVIYSDSVIGQVVYSSTKFFTIIWPLLALCWILKERHRIAPKLLGNWKIHLRALPLGIAVGGLITGIMLILSMTPIWDEVQAGGPAIREKITGLGVLNHYLAFAFFVSVIHSFIEEYYWRWFVYGQLRELVPSWVAHLLAAISFSAHHIIVTTQFFSPALGITFGLLVGVGGWFWSVLYQRQKTLAGAWISHMIVDIALFAYGYQLAGLGG